jgi:hypothetical protein
LTAQSLSSADGVVIREAGPAETIMPPAQLSRLDIALIAALAFV